MLTNCRYADWDHQHVRINSEYRWTCCRRCNNERKCKNHCGVTNSRWRLGKFRLRDQTNAYVFTIQTLMAQTCTFQNF